MEAKYFDLWVCNLSKLVNATYSRRVEYNFAVIVTLRKNKPASFKIRLFLEELLILLHCIIFEVFINKYEIQFFGRQYTAAKPIF